MLPTELRAQPEHIPFPLSLRASLPLAVLIVLTTMFDGQAYFGCLQLTASRPHIWVTYSNAYGVTGTGQGPECMPASSPECCPSLVTTRVTLMSGHLCKQIGHCGDNGFSCHRVQLPAAGLC